MHDFRILFAVAFLFHVIRAQSDVRLPPSIRGALQKNILYERGEALTLECGADGTPTVRYEWKTNGMALNTSNSNVRTGSDGTLTIRRATDMDEGFYQCFARNQYGTALSNKIDSRLAFLNDTSVPSTVPQITVVDGEPLHIEAADRNCSFPKPTYEWYTASYVDSVYSLFWTSKRIQIAENGDLHFAYIQQNDVRWGKFFRCEIFNSHLQEATRGCYTQVTVTKNATGTTRFSPTLAFSSETQTVARIGESAELRCFFYGNPEPGITWTRSDSVLPNGRYSNDNHNSKLTINGITASDDGEYICTGQNSQGSKSHSLRILVVAEPKFNSTNDGPNNVNETEGESATFNCNPIAIPEATIVWFRNGQPIDTNNPSERFVFSNDLKRLTIRDVCRDCVDGERKTDLMVIQCNASNVHGYAFAQGYLNVLMKTSVTIRGQRAASVDFLEEKQIVFRCDATSDPSTPTSVRWYKTEPSGDLVRDEPPYVYVAKEFLIIMVYRNCSSDCSKYLGEYRCVGDNGYSRENQMITLSYEYRHTTPDLIWTEKTEKEDCISSWKIFLGAGTFGLVLFLVGILLGFRSNRCFSDKSRQAMNIKMSKQLREEAGRTYEPSMTRIRSVYDQIGYDSIDQVMKEMEQRGRTGSLPDPPDVDAYNKYSSIIDEIQKETTSSGSQVLDEDIMRGDVGYLVPFEKIKNIENVSDQQHQVNGYESLKRKSVEFPESGEKSETGNLYLELSRQEINVDTDLENSELNPKEVNSYLVLTEKEENSYLVPQ